MIERLLERWVEQPPLRAAERRPVECPRRSAGCAHVDAGTIGGMLATDHDIEMGETDPLVAGIHGFYAEVEGVDSPDITNRSEDGLHWVRADGVLIFDEPFELVMGDALPVGRRFFGPRWVFGSARGGRGVRRSARSIWRGPGALDWRVSERRLSGPHPSGAPLSAVPPGAVPVSATP